VTFGGENTVTVRNGASITSDAVPLRVDAQQDLAISLFVTGSEVRPSQHNNAVVTSYLTDDNVGDQTSSQDGKIFTKKVTSMYWLKSIDVRPTQPASAIVAFGDSITDGTCTTLDGHDRWEDIVAQRLALMTPISRSIVNEGIGGNTVTGAHLNPPAGSPPGLDRLDRDVLSHSGVSHVVLFMGTNDITRDVGAEEVEAGTKDLVTRIKAKGIKVIGVSIIPRHAGTRGWTDAKTTIRHQVNDWLRKSAGFDAFIDFDKIVRSAANPDLLDPAYNCGDGIHPSPIGYYLMGKSVDLGLFLRK
jgi:lysophospholipase L1-like esterase